MTSFKEQYGSWAVVTGASEGIGKAIAILLAEQQFNLILVARREQLLQELADSFTSNIQVKIMAEDVSDYTNNQKIIEQTQKLDVGLLVTSAGFGNSGEFVESTLDEELNMIAVNCVASAHLAHHFGQRFKQQKRGGIMLFSSLVGFQGVPYFTNYAATKAYILSLAEGLHTELKPYGVDVCACAPGPVATGFARRARMKMHFSAQVENVAQDALYSLGKYRVRRTGWLAKLLGLPMILIPRAMRFHLIKVIMQRMLTQ
tara:strand:- start:3068 stop:3844 length:777 start_codon:yes stop_codon:yes gene_type:complete